MNDIFGTHLNIPNSRLHYFINRKFHSGSLCLLSYRMSPEGGTEVAFWRLVQSAGKCNLFFVQVADSKCCQSNF